VQVQLRVRCLGSILRSPRALRRWLCLGFESEKTFSGYFLASWCRCSRKDGWRRLGGYVLVPLKCHAPHAETLLCLEYPAPRAGALRWRIAFEYLTRRARAWACPESLGHRAGSLHWRIGLEYQAPRSGALQMQLAVEYLAPRAGGWACLEYLTSRAGAVHLFALLEYFAPRARALTFHEYPAPRAGALHLRTVLQYFASGAGSCL
jgi:hypothetical protein